jgi:hypothetical protein
MYLVERKCMHKWYTKIFRRLVSAIMLNCVVIYRKNTGNYMHQLALTANLVKRHLQQIADAEFKVADCHDEIERVITKVRGGYFIAKLFLQRDMCQRSEEERENILRPTV